MRVGGTMTTVTAERLDYVSDPHKYLLSLQDADTQHKGEEKFVFLKQGATHVTVYTVGEVVVQVEDSLI